MQTLYQLIKSKAEMSPSATALLALEQGPLSYQGLFQHITATIQCLNGLGIGHNDRVAIVLPNGPAMATAFLSIAAGATSAPLNPNYREPEYDFYLSDLDAKALVILQEAALEHPVVR